MCPLYLNHVSDKWNAPKTRLPGWGAEGVLPQRGLVPRRRFAVGRVPDFAPFFDGGLDRGHAAAAGPDEFLEDAEDQADGAGDHQDHADRVDADSLDVDVGRELEDRADGDKKD